MRGPVVAIHAIHRAMFSLVQLLLSGLRVGGDEFRDLSLIVGEVDDRNRLPFGVGGNVTDALIIREVMSVDADRALPRTSAHLQQQNVGLRRVLFVVFVAGVHQEFVTRKALWPVTLFTGLARRAKILYWR